MSIQAVFTRKYPRKWDVLSGVAEIARDVMSGVTKTALDVLSGVVNLCGMFCLGWQKNYGMFCPAPINVIEQLILFKTAREMCVVSDRYLRTNGN